MYNFGENCRDISFRKWSEISFCVHDGKDLEKIRSQAGGMGKWFLVNWFGVCDHFRGGLSY